MANINKTQIQAVVSTIKRALEKKDLELIKKYETTIKHSAEYREFIDLYEEFNKQDELIINLEKELSKLQDIRSETLRKLHNKTSNSLYYSVGDYRGEPYFKNKEDKFIKHQIEEKNLFLNLKSFNEDDLKNELLIASIDSDFNIQEFIEKYSN